VIHAYAGPTFVLGLTRPNFEQLLLGRPLRVVLVPTRWYKRLFQPRLRELVIVFAEDHVGVLRQLVIAGVDIPPDVFDLAERKP
jgi:hypothetical protein